MLDFKQILDDYAEDDGKTWQYDRNKSLGASEVFGCLRKAYLSKNKYKEDEGYTQSWGAMRRGDIIENDFLVPALEHGIKGKYELLAAGEDQETLLDGYLSATPDGLMVDLPKNALKNYGIEDIESDCIVTEFKSIDPRVHLEGPKIIHSGQVQVQMGLIRELTDWEPEYAVIIYVNCSFLDDISVFVVKFDDKMFVRAKNRAKKLFKTIDPKKLRPEGRVTGDCEYCPFDKYCMSLTIDSIPDNEDFSELDDEVIQEMEKLLFSRKRVDDRLKEAEKEKKELTEQIKEFLNDNDTRVMKGEGWSASRSSVSGRTSYDIKSMVKDGIEIDDYIITGNPYDKLNVRFTKKKD